MKILHVITSLQKAAGTSVFCGEVCNGLVSLGYDVTIAVVNPELPDCYPIDSRIKLIPISSLLTNNYRLSNSDYLIHIHALWSPILHQVSKWAHKNNIPVIWSTHGMTAPWSMRHKLWKKLPAWVLYQRRDLKLAVTIHCTTDQEAEWNKALGFNNCVVVPLGTHLPQSYSKALTHNANHILLFVGRIYPVKGLANLIKAWGMVVVSSHGLVVGGENWKLRIVGPDQAGHLAELEKLVDELGLRGSVEFPGPKFGEELSEEYDNCDCLVLPSFTENFGATIVDALVHGKPCIASSFTPWRELTEYGCGWWVSNEPELLADAIKEMASLDDPARRLMGMCGHKLVEDKYTWDAAVKLMIKSYEEALHE